MATPAPPTRDIGLPDLWYSTTGAGFLSGTFGDYFENTPDLMWPQSITTYGRMKHDPQLKAVLQAYLLPILRANWSVDGSGCRDQVVQLVADDFGLPILGTDDEPGPARRRGVNFRRHMTSAAFNHLVYGHMLYELRYRIDATAPGGCHLDHLGERMPWTVSEIDLARDGTVHQVWQQTVKEPMPASRLLWYVVGQSGANWTGTSMLRPAYGAWILKHETMRVHATSINRWGMGVPNVEAPPGGTSGQVAEAASLAATYRAGASSGIGVPHGFKFNLTGLTGSVPDALGFIEYLDRAMAKMALAGLIELGQTETGSRALGQTFLDLFLLALQATADELAETITSGQDGMPGAVVDLVTQNWGEDEPAPRIVCQDVGENYQVTAEAIARLTEYGALAPDPALDDWIRKAWRLPARETPFAPASPAPGAPAPPGTAEPAPGQGGTPGRLPPGGPAARATAGLRRKLTRVEAASGWQPAEHQAEWATQVAALLTAYRPVLAAQREALGAAVTTQVGSGKPSLGRLTAPVGDGPKVIAGAMAQAAELAALRMATEAAGQGVQVDVGKIKVDKARLGRVASARAALIGQHQAQAASAKALQVAAAQTLMEQAQEIGADITDYLATLSDAPVADQLGAALTAAQGAGRTAVLAQAPPALYAATELLDDNTCGPCQDEDGTEFATLAEAEAAYPNGGYLNCDGGLRCRGTIVAVWGGG